jgi:hypothetical protein
VELTFAPDLPDDEDTLQGRSALGDVGRLAGRAEGSVALSLCLTAHPLYTRFTKIIGTSISVTTMRPNPRRAVAVTLDGSSLAALHVITAIELR